MRGWMIVSYGGKAGEMLNFGLLLFIRKTYLSCGGSVWVYRMASQQVDVWVLHITKGIYERSIARYVAQTFVHISLGQFGGPAVDTVMV